MNDNYQQLYIVLYATIILIIIHCNNLKKKFKKPSKEILTNRIDKEKLFSYILNVILNVKVLYFIVLNVLTKHTVS